MLVLSRKFGQTFQIGKDVTITIVKIDNNSVRIGIEAPSELHIRRTELTEIDPSRLFKTEAA